MATKPLVTIGICARNAQHTVAQAIESVLAQDFPRESIEVILVDDNSDDGTLSVFQRYAKANSGFKIFQSKGKGLASVRNIVIDNAKGNYVVWVDADMMLSRDHVRRQLEFMEENPKTGIAGGTFRGLPEKGIVVSLENLEWTAVAATISERTESDMPCHVCGGAIYRLEAIRQIGGFDPEINGAGEDEDVEWRIAKAGWSVYMGTKAFFYERRKNTWKALWDQYFWYGYGAHFLFHRGIRGVEPSSILGGFICSRIAYQLTHREIAFLLPIQYYFKRIAWYFGLARAHLDGYGHA